MLRSVVSNGVSVKVLLRVSVCASICLKRPMIESTELLISLALFAVVLGWAHIVFDFFVFAFHSDSIGLCKFEAIFANGLGQ